MYPLFAKFIYTIIQNLRGVDIFKYIDELEKTQWHASEELKELQWKRLKEVLNYAYGNILYYQKRFKEIGIHPDDIKYPQDLVKIPLLNKIDVRDNIHELLAKNRHQRLIRYSSSGSTGEPLTLFISRMAEGYFHAAQYRGFEWHGIKVGDKGIKLWGIPLDFQSRQNEKIKDFLLNRKRISAFDLSQKLVKQLFKRCQRFQPKFLYGYASALYAFSQLLAENNLDGKSLCLKIIISTSEVLYQHQKDLIEATFSCKVIQEYGCAEAGIIAFECPQGNMHISTENVYVEFISEGKHVSNEKPGEVIVTVLKNYAMPLIRYKVGDLATPSSGHCPCGRKLPIVHSVDGRESDMLITPDGNHLHSEIFAYINRRLMDKGGGIKEFRITQRNKEELFVKIVKSNKYDNQYIDFFVEQIRSFVGKKMKIYVEYVNSIPLEKSGKKRYFVSEIIEGFRKKGNKTP
ncbi:hypothetical protein AC481_05565 [miscellaneous Crenarchaeota group archaeon SMTZ-80]|nr:MAG: hypothetical protein AC481_05565 [miscellaneous Crenarchaeota group archaeon SMTZ-80]